MEPSWVVTSADGTSIPGFELGGSGAVIVISHATGFCGPAYRRLAQALIGEFRVVAFDFRGHGCAARTPDIDLSWRRMTEDAIAVVDHIAEPVHGFGHSMGGAALLTAAAESPRSFASLFLFEPIVFVSEAQRSTQFPMSEIARRRRSHFGSRAEALARYASNPPFDGVLAGCLSDYVEHAFIDVSTGGVELACTPDNEARTFEHAAESMFERVGAVSTPLMIAIGNDRRGPAALGPPLQDAITGAGLKQYAHIDHLGPFQDPKSVAVDVAVHASATSSAWH